MFILGFDNDRLDILETFHSRFGLGGVILFGRNTDDIRNLKKRLNQIRSITSPDILVAIDQEGGDVVRLAGMDFPTFPSAANYAERDDLDGAEHAAAVTAGRLREIGINFNLNPVADVLTNLGNELMSQRCFSCDASRASQYVNAVVQAQKKAGVASCAKHFPGLGDCDIDPHKKLSVSDKPAEFYREINFKPFEAAIESGCQSIMTTHLLARSLDPDNPATFSTNICGHILRDELGFKGLILSDDLDMGAVESLSDASVDALKAGHDAVLVCHSIDKQISCAENVLKAFDTGVLDEQSISRSIERIKKLKSDFAT